MATRKQKKKKQQQKKQSGGKKASYAKGKKVGESSKSRKKTALKKPAAETPQKKKTGEPAEPERQQWNVVRRGTTEMKVFQVILLILVVATLIQYPLWSDVATDEYRRLEEEYPERLQEWEEKYDTEEAREEHKDEKPVEPKKPTFTDFLLYQALIMLIQGAFFAFLGLNVARRTDLGTPLLDRLVTREADFTDLKDLVTWSVPFSIAALAPLVVGAVIGRSIGYSGLENASKWPVWENALNFVNLVVNYQLMLVLLLFSACVWAFTRYKDRLGGLEPHWSGLVVATLLSFGYIYAISSRADEKLFTLLVGAFFVAFSLVGVLGYLYWKKGLAYSLLAGIISFGVYPFIATLIID